MEELHEARKDDRTEFQRDYDRLIFSAPFRRLQNKTYRCLVVDQFIVDSIISSFLEDHRLYVRSADE